MARRTTINRTLRFMLTLCGIWPNASLACIIIFRAYWLIALLIDEVCHYRYFLMHFPERDLFDLVDCFSSFLTQVKFMTKLMILWFNQRKFIKVLTMMADDWDNCANDDVNMRETTCKAKLADRINNVMFILHALTIFGYSMGILINIPRVDLNDYETEIPLFLKVKLPIDMHNERTYKLLLVIQFIHLLMSSCGTGLLNALLLTLILHIGGQMDILRCWLMELEEREERPEAVAIMTNKIIRKHQKIIIFTEYIEDLYTYIALVQFTSNTVLICSLGFLIVTSIGSPNAVLQIGRSLLFYSVTNLEAFIFCFAGEYLKNKSTAIGNAAYNSAWYKLRPGNSRTLIFIILRAQKQLTVTVGKIMDLSLESFTSIMKASGSYLSVLLAMQ